MTSSETTDENSPETGWDPALLEEVNWGNALSKPREVARDGVEVALGKGAQDTSGFPEDVRALSLEWLG